MRKFTIGIIAITAILLNPLKAQENFLAQAKLGHFIPFNDFSSSTFPGSKPDLFTSVGIGYNHSSDVGIKGELLLGTMNGALDNLFYETTMIEGYLSLNYDLLGLVTESKLRIEAEAGAGLLLYNAKLYNALTRNVIIESPAANTKGLSINTIIGLGGQLAYPVTDNIDVNAGANLKLIVGNDYMDAFSSGDSPDYYGSVFLGLTYNFGKKADPSKIELDRSRYNNLISKVDSLEANSAKIDTEQVAKLEMQNQEKDLKIRMLETKLDSARATVVTVPTDNTQPQNTDVTSNEAVLATPLYRIIIASLPSRAAAQNWIDRSGLDQSGMVIAYVEDLNTYRVIYNSYETLAAAKKDLQPLKSNIPDAWIKKF